MESKRDPRVEPKQNDRLKMYAYSHWRVMSFDGEFVEYESLTNGHMYRCHISKWRKKVSSATVIHYGD